MTQEEIYWDTQKRDLLNKLVAENKESSKEDVNTHEMTTVTGPSSSTQEIQTVVITPLAPTTVTAPVTTSVTTSVTTNESVTIATSVVDDRPATHPQSLRMMPQPHPRLSLRHHTHLRLSRRMT